MFNFLSFLLRSIKALSIFLSLFLIVGLLLHHYSCSFRTSSTALDSKFYSRIKMLYVLVFFGLLLGLIYFVSSFVRPDLPDQKNHSLHSSKKMIPALPDFTLLVLEAEKVDTVPGPEFPFFSNKVVLTLCGFLIFSVGFLALFYIFRLGCFKERFRSSPPSLPPPSLSPSSLFLIRPSFSSQPSFSPQILLPEPQSQSQSLVQPSSRSLSYSFSQEFVVNPNSSSSLFSPSIPTPSISSQAQIFSFPASFVQAQSFSQSSFFFSNSFT